MSELILDQGWISNEIRNISHDEFPPTIYEVYCCSQDYYRTDSFTREAVSVLEITWQSKGESVSAMRDVLPKFPQICLCEEIKSSCTTILYLQLELTVLRKCLSVKNCTL